MFAFAQTTPEVTTRVFPVGTLTGAVVPTSVQRFGETRVETGLQ